MPKTLIIGCGTSHRECHNLTLHPASAYDTMDLSTAASSPTFTSDINDSKKIVQEHKASSYDLIIFERVPFWVSRESLGEQVTLEKSGCQTGGATSCSHLISKNGIVAFIGSGKLLESLHTLCSDMQKAGFKSMLYVNGVCCFFFKEDCQQASHIFRAQMHSNAYWRSYQPKYLSRLPPGKMLDIGRFMSEHQKIHDEEGKIPLSEKGLPQWKLLQKRNEKIINTCSTFSLSLQPFHIQCFLQLRGFFANRKTRAIGGVLLMGGGITMLYFAAHASHASQLRLVVPGGAATILGFIVLLHLYDAVISETEEVHRANSYNFVPRRPATG